MDNLSDTQIRSDLRTLLTESGIDPNRVSLICAGGTVRLHGELKSIYEAPVRSSQVDGLEQSMRRSRGVKRVHVHVENFERLPTGEWQSKDGEVRRERPLRLPSDPDDELA
ncbi:MAG: hypothetical protein ACI8QZ_000115 [Chlamydiales bacterium]|jgi:osmotically-inducible protein OsmY